MDHDRNHGTNGWNDREYDDSSNSNSLDGACIMDNTIISTLKEKPNKLIKSELDMDVSEGISTNRRKRNRALKAIVTTDTIQSDDEKSLNVFWNADDTIKIKEEINSPVDNANLSDSGSNNTGSNNTGDVDAQTKARKSQEVGVVKEEKKMRASTNETIENKTKLKLSSSHCKYCFKKFSNASNLRRHITMSHFGPKKFTCNLCTFRARRKIDILSHVRTKHQFGGERTDAFKFVTVNDEPPPKLPQPASSVNRRKEKHTEVLRDDEEEMFIDSETFMVEGSSEHLLTLGTSNENSNADLDENSANQMMNETVEPAESNKLDTNLKRKGRPKRNDKMKNFCDQKLGESLPARRPIRNRIMPVKKDFVYDLSTLLKKDYKDFHDEIQKHSLTHAGQSQPQVTASVIVSDKLKSRNVSPTPIDNKGNRRRSAPTNAPEPAEPHIDRNAELEPTAADQQKEELRKISATHHPSDMDEIKGAAEAMAQQAVQANKAVFSKNSSPELPAERPVAKPQRQFDSNIMKDWPILKRPPAIFDGTKSKLSNLKVPGLKRKKRSCSLKHSTNTNHKNRVYDKHKYGTNGHSIESNKDDTDQSISETIKISSKLANKIQLKCAQIDGDNTKTSKPEVQGPQSVTSTNSLSSASKQQLDAVATTTPRRMTLLERLAENKTKKLNESLSRMALNSDNDSDEV